MKVLRTQRAGFTLVELLIVIAIIVVLMAIAFPVFSRARERAKEGQCMSNLHQIAQAIRMYRMDEGAYPGPADPITGQGGMNALFPTYITSRKVLICPDDPITNADEFLKAKVFPNMTDADAPTYKTMITGSRLTMSQSMYLWQDATSGSRFNKDATFTDTYSSYNRYYNYLGYTSAPGEFDILDYDQKQLVGVGESVAFVYEFFRWDPYKTLKLDQVDPLTNCPENCKYVETYLPLDLGQQIYWFDYDPANYNEDSEWRLRDTLSRPLWDSPEKDPAGLYPNGIPSAVFPGLIDRNAPDNTIVTRCPNHRSYTRHRGVQNQVYKNPDKWEEDAGKDIVLRLDGSAAMVSVNGANYDWARQP